jgi:hypothetical protein
MNDLEYVLLGFFISSKWPLFPAAAAMIIESGFSFHLVPISQDKLPARVITVLLRANKAGWGGMDLGVQCGGFDNPQFGSGRSSLRKRERRTAVRWMKDG